MTTSRWNPLRFILVLNLMTATYVFSCDAPDCPHQPICYSQEAVESYPRRLLDRVNACIRHDTQFADKSAVHQLVAQLKEKGVVIEQGNDELRVKFVGIQGLLEHVLACSQAMGEISHLVGVIHTPCPAKPLCTQPKENPSKNLLDDIITHDGERLVTLHSRSQIVREYLAKGGKLYVVYPREGLQRRSEEQLAVYNDLLQQYPNHLIDWDLTIPEMHPDMSGATYFFHGPSGAIYTFSIKAKQANQPCDSSEWGLWIGSLTNTTVAKRVDRVLDYLYEIGGPTIQSDLQGF